MVVGFVTKLGKKRSPRDFRWEDFRCIIHTCFIHCHIDANGEVGIRNFILFYFLSEKTYILISHSLSFLTKSKENCLLHISGLLLSLRFGMIRKALPATNVESGIVRRKLCVGQGQ